MATPPYDPNKARLYNQLRQRGLSEDEAWAQSGISEAETFNYVIGTNGELGANISRGSKVAGVDYERPSAAEKAESERWFRSLESGDDDEPPARTSGVFARTTYPQAPSGLPTQQPSVQTIESTTTAQETVTGGSETTIRVGAYERRDTAASRAVQTELDQTNLKIERRKEVLRAEGKNFREMNRDPELFELKAQATRQEIAVENAKQTVEIAPPTIVTTPGPSGTTFQQSVDQRFLTTQTAGVDPTASLSEYDNFTSSGGPVPPASIGTVPPDDPQAGEAEARAFIANRSPAPLGANESEVLPGFTADSRAAGENVGSVLDRRAAPVNPNPWAGRDAEKAAAWAQLSPADQRWLGDADPTDEFILRRAPNRGAPEQALISVQNRSPESVPLPDDNLGFEPLPDDNLAFTQGSDPGPGYGVSDDNLGFEQLPDDNLAFTQGTNPGPGYIDTFDEFGNPVTLPAQLPDDGLAFREGVDPGPGYGVSDDNLGFEQLPDDNLAFQEGVDPGPGYGVSSFDEFGNPVTLDPRAAGENVGSVFDTTVTDTEGYIVADGTLNIPPDGQLLRQPTALGGDYSAQFDPETQTWGVYDNDTGEFIQTGLTEQQATLDAEEYSVGDPNFAGNADAAGGDTGLTPEQAQSQAAAQAATDEAARQNALLQRLREQATISAQRGQANQGDWRVKLRLAEKAQYLYLDPNIQQGGILWPLLESGGVVFPYTPAITTTYAANYSSQDLTHSNYRGYFYQNSYVDEINIQATFTAQDTFEANYLLAVIHFFRSATKMFYGQDTNRGMPPPLVFLQGLGEFQFNLHPCVIRSFNYNLPNDVDYIRARVANIDGTNLLARRDRQTATAGASSLSTIRMENSGLKPGALTPPPAPPTLGTSRPTYVPTKMEATIILLPVQTRQQVSKQFSFKQFANGDLVKGGFW